MSDWVSQKASFDERHAAIQTYVSNQLPTDISTVTTALGTYMTAVGNNQDTTAPATIITQTMATIKQWQDKATTLNSDMTNAINSYASTHDMDSLLIQNGRFQQQIIAAQKRYDEISELANTAVARNKNLRSRETNITSHQVFLLGRPLRPASIPYLWALSVLFVCIAVILFYYYSPITIPPLYVLITMAQDLMYSPTFWSILFGLASIVILFLVLQILGYM